MHFLVHDSPFLTQGQSLRADGWHDELLPLAVFLPQEQPFNPTLSDISESEDKEISVTTAGSASFVRTCSLVDCMFSCCKVNNVLFSHYFENALDK